jgi:flagellar hook-associated protein FlgK
MRNIYHSRMRTLLDAIDELEGSALDYANGEPNKQAARKALVSSAIRMVEALSHLDDEPVEERQ